jgi:hypothetical protein
MLWRGGGLDPIIRLKKCFWGFNLLFDFMICLGYKGPATVLLLNKLILSSLGGQQQKEAVLNSKLGDCPPHLKVAFRRHQKYA